MRLDRALLDDLRTATRSRVILLFLGLQVVAGVLFVARRGESTISTVLLVWAGMLCVAFFAWWAGRDRRAHPQPDAVPNATARAWFALLAAAGMIIWSGGLGMGAGLVLVACGMGGWVWAAWRGSGREGLRGIPARLLRDPRPFLPLLLLIGLPRLVIGGPPYLAGVVVALPSGIGQELLFVVGLFAPLEAALGRIDRAAVLAALVFGLVHVPIVIDANHGDLLAALANAFIFQASVGVIACLAFVRHRAAVPLGVAHAMVIA